MDERQTIADEFALLYDRCTLLTDPRKARGKVHPLPGVMAFVVLGLLAGCRSLSAISRYGAIHPEALPPLGLRRPPSVATLHRLLRMVTVADVRILLRTFAKDVIASRGTKDALGEVAMDGKTMRGTHEGGTDLHVLRLFAQHVGVALDQAPAAPLHGEIDAAETWLKEVAAEFPGLAILTGDALYAEQSLCNAIVAGQRDYVFRLKKTNPRSSPTSNRTLPTPVRPTA